VYKLSFSIAGASRAITPKCTYMQFKAKTVLENTFGYVDYHELQQWLIIGTTRKYVGVAHKAI